jgi:hypothetical protein
MYNPNFKKSNKLYTIPVFLSLCNTMYQKLDSMISIYMEKEIKKKKHTSRSDTWYNLWKEEESLLFSLFILLLKKH